MLGLCTNVGSSCNGSLWVFKSFGLFWCISRVLKFCLSGGNDGESATAKRLSWRLRNTMVSMCHAVITGLWSILCVFGTPELVSDLIVNHSEFSHALVAVAIGYFVFDFLDMMVHDRNRKSLELLAHHVVVVLCFGIAVFTHRFVGFAVVSLLVEVNSTFLHLRQILQLLGYGRGCFGLKTVTKLNLLTFLIFRIGTFVYMIYWHLANFDRIPLLMSVIAAIGMVVVVVMNIVLLYRLLRKDFFKETSKSDEGATK